MLNQLDENVDIKENILFNINEDLKFILLYDNSSGKNLIWATDNYEMYGDQYKYNEEITVDLISGKNGNIIKPRVAKTKEEQQLRSREKAEVFTPAWVCNVQNNLVDNAWFESENMFNTEIEQSWITNNKKVKFPRRKGKSWQDYVKQKRLEISCGEAPYLTSRYDTVTGEYIEPLNRIGLLDRKLRVIGEQVQSESEWIEWAFIAVKSVYGYDWQGDNVFLARENLLETVVNFYMLKFGKRLNSYLLSDFARIISWNIWQMDGLKYVIPDSCVKEKSASKQMSLFDVPQIEEIKDCEGCLKDNPYKHTGIYCVIMDWEEEKQVRFIDLLGRS